MRLPMLLVVLTAGLSGAAAQTQPGSTVSAAAAAIEENYVFPEIGRRIADHLRAREAAGAYARLEETAELARVLTEDIQSVNGDKHLRVFNAAAARQRAARSPTPVARTEVLPGNIGYLDLRVFSPLSLAADDIARAMQSLAGTRALIIDARRHRGGAPDTVAFFCSYLFGDRPVHLNSLYYRATESVTDFFTDPTVPGPRFGPDKPVYVLTSRFTFSAGEELCYNLQTRGRATLVGETTGGGANPGGTHRLPGGLVIFVSNGRAINPVTGTNWEGVGVKPEVAASAAEAFATAYRLALAASGAALDAAAQEAAEALLRNPPTPE